MKSVIFESDLLFLEIFKTRKSTNEINNTLIFQYKASWKDENEKIWEDELTIIKEKYD